MTETEDSDVIQILEEFLKGLEVAVFLTRKRLKTLKAAKKTKERAIPLFGAESDFDWVAKVPETLRNLRSTSKRS